MKYFKSCFSIALSTLILLSLFVTYTSSPVFADDQENRLKGVWVATVFSLDYPSQTTTNASTLKKDIDSILDNTEKMGLNAIFFQVRPASDAFYSSSIYPWSQYLTGTQGTAPANSFDPLAYFVEEAHKRNIELHAWINPYRITKSSEDFANLSDSNPAKKYPDYVIQHTDGNYYYDPALPEVRELIINGTLEIVKNYQVDGIHLDDYFYPGADFPDQASYEKYGQSYSNIGDWRRHNVNLLIQELGNRLNQANPNISFGISPFGIWANSSSHSSGSATNGNQSYYSHYADTKKWAEEGWVDYIAPQIYWNIGYTIADYQILVKWWNQVVANTDTKLYIGMAAYRSAEATSGVWYGTEELLRQLALNDSLANIDGEIFFRYHSILSVNGLTEALYSHYHGAASQNKIFTDLKNVSWAEDSIYKLHERDIVSGKGNKLFDPSSNVKRSEFITMLIQTCGYELKDTQTSSFSDVQKGIWYYPYIAAAEEYGIISGSGTFNPQEDITREDMAIFAYHALLNSGKEISTTESAIDFQDESDIHDAAKEPVSYLTKAGVIHGYEDQTFRPAGLTTRAESAVLICALLELYETLK